MTGGSTTASGDEWRIDWYWIGALGCALVVALVQLVMIGGPLAGYHGYNESFYYTHALQNLERGLADQILRPIDPNNPFLYPLALATWLRVFGPTVVAGRLLGVVLSVALVLLTFWIARQLYNKRIALLSAVFASVTPGVLLTGRNMQTDTLMLVLVLAALGCFLKAVPSNSGRWAVAAGAFFGLSFVAKLPAVLFVVALAIWQVWRGRGWEWLKDRATWITAAVAGAVGLPWYLARILGNTQFAGTQGALASNAAEWIGFDFLYRSVWSEQVWMLTPLVAIAAVLGVGVAVWKRTTADKLLLSIIAVFSVFFLFFNFHSYYFVALLPFFVILASRALWTLWARSDRRVLATAALVVVLALPLSVLIMSGKKWTTVRIDEAPLLLERAGFDPDRTTIGMSPEAEGTFGPAVTYYFTSRGFPKPQLFADSPGEVNVGAGNRLAVLSFLLAGDAPGVEMVAPLNIEMVAPVVFGQALRMDGGLFHFYAPGELAVERVGPWWQFGVERRFQGVDIVLYEVAAE
ncbi:MAG: glycosyltransferase family 39 protein [Coriobacteriia bacterium]|nr:glycosyltransferase family 39 protein [Coriobacteriia bacterium]